MAEPCPDYEFIVSAEDFQFYLQDEKAETEFPETMHDELTADLFTVGDRIVGVGTVRPTDVQVIVECIAEEPDEGLEDLEDWDQVVECSIDLPSGTLVITNNIEDFAVAARVPITPGIYRMRIYYGMLDEVDAEGFEGDDFYKILLWPGRMEESRIWKKWSPTLNFEP
jgi:hypothetical protein